ncbi:polysulfide reductase NrfD [bacterium]|nr:polysulfide reductase NrfD [bacterium]
MLDFVLRGSRRYWIWMISLGAITALGFYYYVVQLKTGLVITGLGRDNTWGLYTAQMNFLVGVAAGGVMLVLPYYLHNYKKFGKITILGEFLAVPALCMCLLFLLIHLGKPSRFMNVFLHPTPTAMVFWDSMVIMAYLVLNLVLGWTMLEAERKLVAPPAWTKPLIYLSIPMAFAIHTVTAFLYCGVAGRSFWLTAILAPRFLASAFAAGPSLLILLAFLIRKLTKFDSGKEAIQTLAIIVTYGLLANIFFLVCEVFVAFYSNIPGHKAHFIYLYAGLDGKSMMVPWMWTSVVLLAIAAVLLIIPATRKREPILGISCAMVFLGIWIDKGLGLMAGGFSPNPFHQVVEYMPTLPESIIAVGVWAIGALILTVLYKVVVSVKEEVMA